MAWVMRALRSRLSFPPLRDESKLVTQYLPGVILAAFILIWSGYSAGAQLDQESTPKAVDATGDSDNPLPTHLQPMLVDSGNSQIGILIGTTHTYDQSGMPVKAYELVTHTGHLVAIQPNGKVGGVNALYFQSENCSGLPYLLAQHADRVNEIIPGYIFAFGIPSGLYVVSKQSVTEKAHARSVSRARTGGDVCEEINLTGDAYNVALNNAHETGISTVQFDRVNIQMLPLEVGPLRRGKHSFVKDLNIDMDRAPSPSLTSQQCSPGCDIDLLSNGICEAECSTRDCGYDANDCSMEEIEDATKYEESLCAPSCEPGDLGDGFCDKLCNNSACNYDEGDCKDK